MPRLTAYLSFDGNAAEAMRFYEKLLGGKVDVLLKAGDVPDAARHLPKTAADRILHAELLLKGGDVLMASDWMAPKPYEGMKGFSVALSFEDAPEARRIFETLTQGGATILPMQPSFFAETFGMLIDRFGTPWSISGGARQK